MTSLATQIERAGFAPDTPISIARCGASGIIETAVAGLWPDGRLVALTDRFYGASLAKQVTAAALALLVLEERLDPDRPLAHVLGDLPAWSATITPRQLVHHISGLPAAGEIEPLAPADWSEDFALGAMRSLPELSAPPGTTYAYSNLGYVLLARLVAAVSGQPFKSFVATRLLEPLGIAGMGFIDDIAAQPQAPLLGPRLPLTHGDGGLWSTAHAFAQWLHQQNIDALGIAALVEAPARLSDGQPVAYGWGLGLRQHRGRPLLIHGGEWPGAVAKTVRSPVHGITIVAMAASSDFAPLGRLIDAVLDEGLP